MSLTISLSPQQVEERFGRLGIPSRFSEAETARLSTTSIVNPGPGIFTFPTPEDNSALSLLKIRETVGTDPKKQPSVFDHPWYMDESFMKAVCPPGWHSLYIDVVPESVNQPSDYAHSLPAGQQVPMAVEVVLMLFLHYVGTGEQLLLRKHTWCSDQASMGRQVTIGAFGRNGVFISGHPVGFASRGLGICPKIVDCQI